MEGCFASQAAQHGCQTSTAILFSTPIKLEFIQNESFDLLFCQALTEEPRSIEEASYGYQSKLRAVRRWAV